MKAEIKQRWVAALRSGNYEQGEGALRQRHEIDDNAKPQYCCLGVLCDLHRISTKRVGWTESGAESEANFNYYNEDCFLPDPVAKWAGLTDEHLKSDGDVAVTYRGEETCLSQLNDGKPGEQRRLTFKQIANIIEKQL